MFHSRITIPATPGTLTLYYPKWIPGEHGPTGPVVDTAGIVFTANGKRLNWRRDPLDMFTYHVEVPQGATNVEATIDYMSPTKSEDFSSGASATSQMAVLAWNWVVLYPKGWGSDQIQVKPSLRLPAGWKFGSALPVASQQPGNIDFTPASLTTVIDSPVIMGAHLRVVPLQQGKTPAHEIDVAGESEAALQISDTERKGFDNLVAEAGALFGARHYRHYNFLLSLSDNVAHFGLEHHESNDSRLGERYFLDPVEWTLGASLLPHEYTHSWNGKYRRPEGLATPEYETPMQSELLWVYEGLTQYFGYLLTARSGLYSPEQWRDEMAIIAGRLSHWPGREWRSLEDTATAAQVLYNSSQAYSNWRRDVDFYDESALIWLEADVIIRKQTSGKKSMDDFAHIFHGPPDSPPMVKPYGFDDVVNTLNQVAPYDWRKFLADRIVRVAPQAPLGGIEAGGYKLVYTPEPSALTRMNEQHHKGIDCSASLGLLIRQSEDKDEGEVVDVIRGMIADKAGMAPGMKIIAVNGRRFSDDVLMDALRESTASKQPIELLAENDDYFKTYSLDYHDGPRYPHLVRDESKPDVLSDIIKPKMTTPATANAE
jgi:predicted metalloprotease with PDZ domain